MVFEFDRHQKFQVNDSVIHVAPMRKMIKIHFQPEWWERETRNKPVETETKTKKNHQKLLMEITTHISSFSRVCLSHAKLQSACSLLMSSFSLHEHNRWYLLRFAAFFFFCFFTYWKKRKKNRVNLNLFTYLLINIWAFYLELILISLFRCRCMPE